MTAHNTLEFLGHPDEGRPVHLGPARHVGKSDVGAARQAITVDCSLWKESWRVNNNEFDDDQERRSKVDSDDVTFRLFGWRYL